MQDVRTDDREKDECFSDAMIAEIEADIYGLQVCILYLLIIVIYIVNKKGKQDQEIYIYWMQKG